MGVGLSDSSIGIKVADGTFYPVLEEGFEGRKKVILTTVRDSQTAVQIDLYRGQGQTLESAEYVGSLIIENIPPSPKGDPEIEVVLGMDRQGNLDATASDRVTGERQTLSVSMQSLGPDQTYDIPEFSFDKDEATAAGPAAAEPIGLEDESVGHEDEPGVTQDEPGGLEDEDLIAGEAYPVDSGDRRRGHLEHRGQRKRSPLLLAILIVLALLIIVGVAWLVYSGLSGPTVPSLQSGGVAPPAEEPAVQPAAPASAAVTASADSGPVLPAPAKPPEADRPEAGAAPAAMAQPDTGVWYRIKWGDTLWDLSGTYYRNPWLYPKIAKANRIKNPDLIFAETKLFIPEI